MRSNVAILAAGGAAGLLVAGALYLYYARGTALLIDLASSIGGVLCF